MNVVIWQKSISSPPPTLYNCIFSGEEGVIPLAEDSFEGSYVAVSGRPGERTVHIVNGNVNAFLGIILFLSCYTVKCTYDFRWIREWQLTGYIEKGLAKFVWFSIYVGMNKDLGNESRKEWKHSKFAFSKQDRGSELLNRF